MNEDAIKYLQERLNTIIMAQDRVEIRRAKLEEEAATIRMCLAQEVK